jgi:hypothetical protein
MPACVSRTHAHTRTRTRTRTYTRTRQRPQTTSATQTSDTNTKKQEKSAATTVDAREPRTTRGRGNTCVGRLLASSGPTTLSLVLTVKFKECVQGIGPAICLVNTKLFHKAVSQAFFGIVERLQDLHTHTQDTAVAGGAVAALRKQDGWGKKNSKLANQGLSLLFTLRHLRSLCPPKCPSLSCFLLCASAVSMSFHRRFAEHGVH